MKLSFTAFLRIAALLAILVLSGLSLLQEIPKGVRYKKATPKINADAIALTKKLLSLDTSDGEILSGLDQVLVCGPGLWGKISPSAKATLKDGKPMTFMVPYANGVQKLNGRFFKTKDGQMKFWLYVLAYHQKHKPLKMIRKANPSEISYYWALIPYDIEEPILVADYGTSQLLLDFTLTKGKPAACFVDIIGKMKKDSDSRTNRSSHSTP